MHDRRLPERPSRWRIFVEHVSEDISLYILAALATLAILLFFGILLWGCGGPRAELRQGSAEMGHIAGRTYAAMEASGELGAGQLDVSTVFSWGLDEPALLDGLMWLNIKSLLRVGVEYECVFDDNPACEVCALYGGGRLCFWIPPDARPVPPPKEETNGVDRATYNQAVLR